MCWYLEHLAQQGHAPASISNAVSHLRTYYQMAGLDTAPLHHFRVGLALRALHITIRHVPAQRGPVSPDLLKAVIAIMDGQPSSKATRLAFILMFTGFLRQSSVAPQSVAAYDPTRHLSAADLTLNPQGLRVAIKWTKTLQSAADATSILLPSTADPTLCPVTAYRSYRDDQRTSPAPDAPLLTHTDGNTLTVPFIRRQWAALIKQVGADPAQHTLHSLRKGGATFTYNVAKARLNDVMTHGTWRSQAVRSYIAPAQGPGNSVYQALQRL